MNFMYAINTFSNVSSSGCLRVESWRVFVIHKYLSRSGKNKNVLIYADANTHTHTLSLFRLENIISFAADVRYDRRTISSCKITVDCTDAGCNV